MTAWQNYVRRIANGDALEAGQFNITLDQLIQRDQYLKEALDLAVSGTALIDFDVELDVATLPGTPVYLDSDTGVYKPAQALLNDSGVSLGQMRDEAYVKGIVYSKTATQRGHVVLSGIIPNGAVDWSLITTDGTTDPGHYFLSAVSAGEISKVRSSAAIYLGQLIANGDFHLSRNDDVSAEDHIHNLFVLTNAPAVADPADLLPAVPASPTGTWDISGVVDASQRGWLNANNPALGPAPIGAVFGYNIDQEPDLDGVFPPIPILAAFATLGRDVVNSEQLIVDANGIWWLDDRYDQVPWAVDYATTGIEANLYLYLASLTTDTASRGVSTLRASADSLLPIIITNLQGNDAQIGDLQLAILELLIAGAVDRADGVAVKAITDRTMDVGPVVDSIEIVSSGLTATATVNDAGKLSGRVQLSLNAGTINQFIIPRIDRLVGAQQDQFREFTYISLPASRDTAVVYQLTVPAKGVPLSGNLRMQLSLLSRGDAALPDLVIEQRVVTPVAGLSIGLPTAWTAVETLSGINIAGDTVELVPATITVGVQPGSEVLFRVSRAGSTDGYAAAVGILRAAFILES